MIDNLITLLHALDRHIDRHALNTANPFPWHSRIAARIAMWLDPDQNYHADA